MSKFIALSTVFLFAGCSCSTIFHSKSDQSAKSQSTIAASAAPGARVQGNWQTRFEFAVKEAGSGSEGWALFADSAMGHSGQQLVVLFPDGSVKLCYAPQSTNDCSYQNLDTKKWQALINYTNQADGLSDRPLQSFDTQNLEYVHIKNIEGTISKVASIFFMVDNKPLPKAYDELVTSFTQLNK